MCEILQSPDDAAPGDGIFDETVILLERNQTQP
jgi:hypothetical protein